MLESQDRIVTEDVAPLFDQATGLDTPPASGTVTTTIEESRSVITAIIRKAWTATLTMLGGASVIGYITAAYTYLRTRLQGNETYGIPDRRSEISASSSLAANLALLNDRKIGGVPEAADGMSLVHLVCNSATLATVTELTDNTVGWTYDNNQPTDILISRFPNVEKVQLGCAHFVNYLLRGSNKITHASFTELEDVNADTMGSWIGGCIHNLPNLVSLLMPKFKRCVINAMSKFFITSVGLEKLELPVFERWSASNGSTMIIDCPNLKEFIIPNSKYLYNYANVRLIANCPKIEKVVIGDTGMNCFPGDSSYMADSIFGDDKTTNLIHVEIGEGFAYNFALGYWNPTNVLADNDKKALFLQNFRDYIANRLTDNGSGKTLTLSQAVRNAIHAAESTYGIENIIITQKGWTISPAPN